jgi:hypothetical protein
VRRARRVDRNHGEIRTVLRSLCPAVADTSGLGDGFPDLVVKLPGGRGVVLVEVKDGSAVPSARRNTERETVFAAKWGDSYLVIKNVDEAIALARGDAFGKGTP